MIIDFHTHIMHPDVISRRDDYCRQDACFASLYSQPKATLSTAEELINIMDDCEISKSVVLNINWLDHDLCVRTNDYILDTMHKYRDRIIAFISIQPQAGDAAIKEMERCIKAGARGVGEVRLDLPCFGKADDKTLEQIFDIMIKNNLIFLVHSSEPVGHEYSGKGKVTPDILYSFIMKYPKLKVVCAHLGGGLPFYALMPEVGEALKHTWFDSAATPFLYKAQVFRQLIEIAGSDKLLFGSDFPLMSPEIVLQYMKLAEMDAADNDRVLFGNALQLLAADKPGK